MAKQSGLGARLLIDSHDLSGDVGQANEIGGGPGLLDVTGLNVDAYERIGAVRDGRLVFTSFFNPSTAHPTLAALPTSDVIGSYAHRALLDADVASLVARQLNYDGTRGNDGALTLATTLDADGYGLQWGNLRTVGLQAVTATGALTSVHDVAASTAFGAQAFIHLTAFTGTNITVTLQHSNDDGAGDAYATITGLSATLTAVGATRVATAGGVTVKQWTRVNLTGTFSAATLAVGFVRNLTQVNF